VGAAVDWPDQPVLPDAYAGLLEKLAHHGSGQGLSELDRSADREPIRRLGSSWVMAKEEENLTMPVAGQDTGGLTCCSCHANQSRAKLARRAHPTRPAAWGAM